MRGHDGQPVLIVAPSGQDAAAISATLNAKGVPTLICRNLGDCAARISDDAAALLLAEEALDFPSFARLREALGAQPSWSELPIIVLTSGGENRLATLLDLTASASGTVTTLERPMRAATLVSAVQVALRARRRQRQVRDLLEEQHRNVRTLESAVAQLREAEEAKGRLAAIVESSDDAIISTNLDGVITSWNFGAQKLFGYAASEAIGRSIMMLMPEDRADEEPAVLERIRGGERVDHYETVRRRKDGMLVELSLSVSPIIDAKGDIIGESKIARDISERRRVEEDRRRWASELERALADRTLELMETHEAARRTEAMAVLGALAGGISHDLGNLLLPLRVRLDMLQRLELPVAARDHVEILGRNIEYLAALTGRLRQHLTDSGRDARVHEPFDPVKWLHDHERFYRGILPPQMRLECVVPPNLPMLAVSQAALTQAVYNLVQNAGKAMSRSGVGRTVTLRASSDGDGWLLLGVEDDGPGMPPDVLSRCMDRSFTTDANAGSLGLGLSLVKAFVDSTGASIEVQSPPAGKSRGAAFILRLSTARAAMRPSPARGAGKPAQSSA